MVESTLKRIKEIEEKAAEIIRQARHSATLELKKTREKHERELCALEDRLHKENTETVRAAREEAEKEAARIIEQAAKDAAAIRKNAEAHSVPAKKEILRCL